MQRAAELTRAKLSLTGEKKIAKKRFEAITNLWPIHNDVLEIVQTTDKAAIKQSLGALTKDLLQVHDVPLDTLCSEFAAYGLYCNDPRNSIVSSSGSSLSGFSVFSQASTCSSVSSILSHYSGRPSPSNQPEFICPTCNTSLTRANDLVKHMRETCKENLIRYKCYQCDTIEESERKMRAHIREHASRSSDKRPAREFDGIDLAAQATFQCPHCPKEWNSLPAYHEHLSHKHGLIENANNRSFPSVPSLPGRAGRALGFDQFELPAKASFGCPHCSRDIAAQDRKLLDYHNHLIKDHFPELKANSRGFPSVRVRNAIRGAGLAGDMQHECREHELHADSWESFDWDDANADWFSDRLEYGVKDPLSDPFSHMGIVDKPSFVKGLIAKRIGAPKSSQVLVRPPFDEVFDASLLEALNTFDEGEALHADPAGPSAPPIIPPVAYHPNIERLRNEQRMPMRAANTQLPPPPPPHQQRMRPLPARPRRAPQGPVPMTPTSGHKHKISAGSEIHPDGTDRAQSSPVPPGIHSPSPHDLTFTPASLAETDLSDLRILWDDLDAVPLPLQETGAMSPAESQSYFDWSD